MAKKRLKKRVRLILTLFIGFLFIGGIFFVLNKDIDKSKLNNPIKKITSSKKEKEVWPKVYKASLVASGDGLPHSSLYKSFWDPNTDTFDFTPMTSEVDDIIKSYDIAYYNQETVLGGKRTEVFNDTSINVAGYYGGGPGSLLFNSPSEFADAMIKAGFNTISTVTNHSLDCGNYSKECIENTYNYLASKDVVFDGYNIDETEENKYNIGEVNGITYGILNYTNTFNGRDRYKNGIEYLVDEYSYEKAEREIKELKEKVDVVIVAMHWHKESSEYKFTPTSSNIAIANELASFGADIILGTYSHCVQPFDVLENGTVVFYSLGNFISNQLDLNYYNGYYPFVGAIGMLASMDITKTVYEDGTKEIKIDNFGADLLFSYHDNNHQNYKAVPFSKMRDEYNFPGLGLNQDKYHALYDEYSGYITSLNPNITIAPFGSKLSKK